MSQESILFIYTSFTQFVKTDFEILSSVYKVKESRFKPVHGLINTALEMTRQFFFLLFNVHRFDAVYIWFADYHSFLPVLFAKVFGKKSYVVIGGYEVGRVRDLHYGALCSKFRGFFCIRSMRMSSLNLTVSSYVDRKMKYIAPGAKRKLVYNCVDFDPVPDQAIEKEKLVLTVGIIENERSFKLKGIDTFIEVARITPEYSFVIVGLDKQQLPGLIASLPANIHIYGKVAHNELASYYRKAKYYCQLSRSESFGVSIAEAMFYKCIPIVTNEGGMPELAGASGFIVKRDVSLISSLIKNEPAETRGMQQESANRIRVEYSRAKRKESITSLISHQTAKM